MKLFEDVSATSSTLMLLAPANALVPEIFQNVTRDQESHARVLASVQAMRGSVALNEGAVQLNDLEADHRYEMPGDSESWHLLRVGPEGKVRSSARILVHSDRALFSALRLAHSALATSATWSQPVRFAVEADLAHARMSAI